ncbi:MAG: Transducin (beta)-like 3, partial [Paramarteilia canceri]
IYKERYLLTSYNEKLNKFDLDNKKVVCNTDIKNGNSISDMIFSSKHLALFLITDNFYLEMIDVESFELIYFCQLNSKSLAVSCCALNNDHSILAVGTKRNNIILWSIPNRQILTNMKNVSRYPVIQVQFLNLGSQYEYLVFTNSNYDIVVYDYLKSTMKTVIRKHIDEIVDIYIASDSTNTEYLVLFSKDKTISFWDHIEFKCLRTFPSNIEINRVSQVNKNTFLCASLNDIFDLKILNINEVSFKSLISFTDHNIKFLSTNETTNEVFVLTEDWFIFIINCSSGQINQKFLCNLDVATNVEFLNRNKSIFCFSTSFANLCCINIENKSIETFTPAIEESITSIKSLISCEKIFISTRNGSLHIFYYKIHPIFELCFLNKIDLYDSQITCIESSNSNTSLFCSGSRDGILKIWLLNNKSEINVIATMKIHSKDISCLKFSPKSKLIASGSLDKDVKIWNANTLQLLSTLSGHKRAIKTLRWMPDNSILTMSIDSIIKHWSAKTYSCLKTFESYDVAQNLLLYSINTNIFITVNSNSTIKVWNTNSLSVNSESVLENISELHKVDVISNESTLKLLCQTIDDLIILEDCTEEKKEETYKNEQKNLKEIQKINQCMIDGHYLEAIEQIIENDEVKSLNQVVMLSSTEDLKNIISQIKINQIQKLLKIAIEMVKHKKFRVNGQIIISIILSEFDLKDIAAISDIDKCLDAFSAYSERHSLKIDSLAENMHFISLFKKGFNINTTLIKNSNQKNINSSSKNFDNDEFLQETLAKKIKKNDVGKFLINLKESTQEKS